MLPDYFPYASLQGTPYIHMGTGMNSVEEFRMDWNK